MPERNVDFQDILNVLNWGKVVHDPDQNTDKKFKVLGEDLEGVRLCVVVIIFGENALLVKTVHGWACHERYELSYLPQNGENP